MKSVDLGRLFETKAIAYLQGHNLKIIDRNFRCKLGEVDIIADDQGCLVFAEVRFRKHDSFGTAAESVTLTKQRKIICTAQYYMQTRAWARNSDCRFDVLAISQTVDTPHIEWIKDAFYD